MPTVNEPISPRAVRGMLEALKIAIVDIAGGEKEAMKSKAAGLSALRRERMLCEEQGEGKLEHRVRELNEAHEARLEAAASAKLSRDAWLKRAYHAARAGLALKSQEGKDRKIGRAQGEIMQRRQERQAELKSLVAEHGGFIEELAADRARLLEIRRGMKTAIRSFRPLFSGKATAGEVKVPTGARQCQEELGAALTEGTELVGRLRVMPLAMFFRFVPLTALLVAICALFLWLGFRGGLGGVIVPWALSLLGVTALWGIGLVTVWKLAGRGVAVVAKAERMSSEAERISGERIAILQGEIQHEEEEQGRGLNETFRESAEEWREVLAAGHRELDGRYAVLPERLDTQHAARLEALQVRHGMELSSARADIEGSAKKSEESQALLVAEIEHDAQGVLEELAERWKTEVLPQLESLGEVEKVTREGFPLWTKEACESWVPPEEAPGAVRIGRLRVDAAVLADGLPGDARFNMPESAVFNVPVMLAFPDEASLLIETDGSDNGAGAEALHHVALRLVASFPPGRISFVLIDPVGLGKDFAGLMHLADYEESLITSRIWTQSTHIEERLAELNEHIEKVIQMYLRDEYATIAEYNAQAGVVAEKTRFLVIAGFPAGFSETAMKRLMSIASSGARCGVHLLVQRDTRQPMEDVILLDKLRKTCRRVVGREGGFHFEEGPLCAGLVEFDAGPSDGDSVKLVNRIGKASVDSNRVKVPFSQVAPPADKVWSELTGEELRVPIGRTGAKKLQMLSIGKGTKQHMLVAGKTGSGKSTLFHVIITNLALWCSPREVEFYLVDFKKGVEFKCYAAARLPHARVVAIESDREFALSVLQRVDAELKSRGELFRQAGVQDLAGYRRGKGAETVPRSLLLIDEFQEFFTEDDAVAQEASLLLDRIVRQGRAFGIHVILGSQTLGGAYTLARATLGQMVIRVALQCNETDAHLIMDEDNPAPRLLTRPGEGIYNDQAGALAANSPFQIVWLPEEERDEVLKKVALMAAKEDGLPPGPIVFEGNAPAEIGDNLEFAELLVHPPTSRPKDGTAWLGAPNSIKGPTEARFQRQSGSHLLVVGQSTERAASMLAISLASLAAQYPADRAEFLILDAHFHDSDEGDAFRRLAAALPHKVTLGGPGDLQQMMEGLSAQLAERVPTSGKDAPEVFVLVRDLQRFKNLRPEDDFKFSMDDEPAQANPSAVFAELLGEGGPCGMHVIASVDTWNNTGRWIPRKLMAEFEMRVLFQMSANDSANLIDSPAAANLGLHRALFYNEHLGTLETFRPYAMPDGGWFAEIETALRKGIGV